MNNELPYDFDLVWDIKTEAQLVREYLQAKKKATGIEEVCKSHDIDIKKLIAKINNP